MEFGLVLGLGTSGSRRSQILMVSGNDSIYQCYREHKFPNMQAAAVVCRTGTFTIRCPQSLAPHHVRDRPDLDAGSARAHAGRSTVDTLVRTF